MVLEGSGLVSFLQFLVCGCRGDLTNLSISLLRLRDQKNREWGTYAEDVVELGFFRHVGVWGEIEMSSMSEGGARFKRAFECDGEQGSEGGIRL